MPVHTLSELLRLKHETQLLKGATLGFGEEEVDRQPLYDDPTTVKDVVSPANGIKRNGVDVGVEEDGKPHSELLKRDTFGALLEGEEFDEVGVGKSVPRNVVEPRAEVSDAPTDEGVGLTVSRGR